jgi:hypothetical protein
MASTGLNGPYALTTDRIDVAITKTSPGAYALGVTTDGTFYVSYVGRSDTDVNARLKNHVGSYKHFKYGYFSSPKAAFEKECNLYHDFDNLDNDVHPARPAGSNWTCPRCRTFG